MSQRRKRIATVRSLRGGVERLQRARVHGPHAASIHKPDDSVGISVCRNDGVTSTGNFDGLHAGWSYQRPIAKSVSIYWTGLTGEIYGVVPIHRCATLSTSAQGDLLNNLRVTRSAGRTKLAQIIPIQNIDRAFLAFGNQFVWIWTRLVRQNQNAVVQIQIIGGEVLLIVGGEPVS